MDALAILVIEDNPITQEMVRLALESEGYSVLVAGDGKTAIEMMRRHSPDLVLQDLILPDMDGLDLVRELRALPGCADVPILACSGFLPRMEQARGLGRGFTDYLFKPVEPSMLLQTIRTYLRPAAAFSEKPGRGRLVLVAHDAPMQLKLIKLHLEEAGFQVLTAPDGAAALECATSSVPSAIVSDVMMPRLDGFQLSLAVRLHPRLAGVRVLLISAAYTEEADRRLAQTVGASDLILSTPDCTQIVTALVRALREPLPPLPSEPVELTEEYAHRVIRQLEHQAALNTTLSQRLSMREAELAILAGMADMLKSTVAVEKVLDVLLYRCLDAAGVSRGAAYLLESDGRLSMRASLGYSDDRQRAVAEFFGHAGLLRESMNKGEPLSVPLVAGTRDDSGDLLEKAGARSILIAPLVTAEQSVGAMVMASASRHMGEDWVAFAKAVGAQIGQAIGLTQALSLVRENQEKLERIVGTMADGLLILNREGRFTFANAAAERILGLPAAEITERTHNDPRWRTETPEGRPFPEEEQPFVRVAASGDPLYGVEQAWFRPDGTRVILSINSAPLRDGAGEIIGTVRSISDITDRKRAEEALAQQAKDLSDYAAELERFAYVASHDLQEPLRTVASFTQLLAQRYKGKLDPTADKFVEHAVGGCIRMRRLIEDLLEYSRVACRGVVLEPTDSESAFQKALVTLRGAVEETAALVTHDPLPTVMADGTRLSQVLEHLVGNAIKFHSLEPPRVHVSAELAGKEWVFSVQDNGMGIDPQHSGRIFTVFERLHARDKYSGTGVGLAICKRIVERHQGRIWVESEPQKGSKFCFTIPADGGPS